MSTHGGLCAVSDSPQLTTRPLSYRGAKRWLFVNVQCRVRLFKAYLICFSSIGDSSKTIFDFYRRRPFGPSTPTPSAVSPCGILRPKKKQLFRPSCSVGGSLSVEAQVPGAVL